MCIDGIDGQLDVFHFTAVRNWRQFDDGVQRYFQVWQILYYVGNTN